ncbi:hypothetical protein H0H92_013353 [Tricholoma furcatifolium]|nr:hypothetical protein H0H92_013353 [Tricholoma furcatifolium]
MGALNAAPSTDPLAPAALADVGSAKGFAGYAPADPTTPWACAPWDPLGPATGSWHQKPCGQRLKSAVGGGPSKSPLPSAAPPNVPPPPRPHPSSLPPMKLGFELLFALERSQHKS